MSSIRRILSGGQTGVDRAALDVARALGIPCGGWCPKGRLAEDGVIPSAYPLMETPSAEYAQRTEWNARDADGTLVLTYGAPSGGTAYTIACARRLGKPCLVMDLRASPDPAAFQRWCAAHVIQVLNIAGPRESRAPGEISRSAKRVLEPLLKKVVRSS